MSSSPYTVSVNVQGTVNPSVTRSIGLVTQQLKGLQAQVLATNRAISLGFGRLLGASAALVGITSLVSGMKEAVRLSKDNEQVQLETLTILKNQRELHHQSSELAVQDLKTLNEQAIRLQEQTGLYKNIFERGSAILAQSHRNVQEIQSLQPHIANLLVGQKELGRSTESMQEIYHAIGKSIETGMARNLNAIGVILTAREKQLLMMYAKTQQFGESIKLIERAIDRTYAGAAKFRLQTLTGRTDLAMANMQLGFEKMGDALKPVGQRLTIIFSQIVTLIEPVVTEIANDINQMLKDHMKDIRDWITLVKTQVVPILVQWVKVGFAKIKEFIVWYQQNRDWINPWIKNIALVGAGLFVIVQAATALIALTNPFSIFVGLFLVLGSAILAAMTNMRDFKTMMQGAAEWLFGTKRLDPRNEGYGKGVRRGFKKGEVPRAQPVQPGVLSWYVDWIESLNKPIDNFFNKTLPGYWKKFVRWITGEMGALNKTIDGWANGLGSILSNAVINIVKAIDSTIKTLGKQFWWLNPGGAIGKALSDWFWGFGTQGGGSLLGNYNQPSTANPVPVNIVQSDLMDTTGVGNGVGGTGAAPIYNLGQGGVGDYKGSNARVPGGGYRVYEQYPWEGSSSNYGPGHVYLGVPNEIGLGTNLQQQYGVRPGRGRNDWVKVQFADGTVQWRKLMETSAAKGNSGIEFWSASRNEYLRHGATAKILDVSHGRPADLNAVDLSKKTAPTPAKSSDALKDSRGNPVSVSYNVTNHIHGGEDLERRMAAIHKQHIDQLTKDIAEVTYRNNRSAFDGAHAV